MLRVAGGILAVVMLTGATTTQDTYGAIYYTKEGRYLGYAWGHTTQTSAEDEAYSQCRSRGADCQRAVWFRNACGAFALGDSDGWGSDWGTTKAEAERKALQACRDYGNNDCQIEVSLCSND
jgi:hypothetical protein